jgi:hypothetical protein
MPDGHIRSLGGETMRTSMLQEWVVSQTFHAGRGGLGQDRELDLGAASERAEKTPVDACKRVLC